MASPTTYSLQPQPQPQQPPSSTPDDPGDPLSTVPPLTTQPATDSATQIDALHLISDSVAQQRQLAANAVIFHPLTLALYIAILAFIHQLFYKGRAGDLAIVLTTGAGVTMAGLLGVRWLVGGYLALAEEVGTWRWLGRDDAGGGGGKAGKGGAAEGGDIVLVTTFGEEVIGAVVLRPLRDGDATTGNKGAGRRRQRSNSGGNANGGHGRTKGLIRAWTVRQKYRHKGVGGALLAEVVTLCRDKGWSGPVFADDHANSARVLPKIFNRGFEVRETKARRMLERYVEESNAVVGNNGKVGNGGRRR